MSITVYGASDDLIEIEGDIREEFDVTGDADDGLMLGFSDGTVLSVRYANDGNWRISVAAKGTSEVQHVPAGSNGLPENDEDYSDRATLDGDIAWVVCGEWRSKR